MESWADSERLCLQALAASREISPVRVASPNNIGGNPARPFNPTAITYTPCRT